jgi:tetratricopeptide (TPR) repeat protein
MMGVLLMWLWLSISPMSDWNNQAQRAYEVGNYQEAVTYYQIGLSEGARSTGIYFNLGNSYLGLGDMGHAMLYYLRAGELSPRDEAIQASIERVRALRRDYQQEAQDWGDYIADVSASFLRLDEMVWLAVMVWMYGCVLWSFVLIRRQVRQRKIFLIVNTVIIGVVIGIALIRFYSATYRPEAVIIAPITTVMSGASQDYLSLYNLHAGAEVRIIERQGGWAWFVMADGSSGWINRFDFEYVSPQ